MAAGAHLSAYLPRFLIAVVAVPAAFALCAFAAVRFSSHAPETPAAGAAAITFALVVLAPSTRNALARAAIALALASLVAGAALLSRA
jgi:hypothetical protein